MNLRCKVCGEKAAGFHFGAFTCEGCKSFFGRCCNNMSVIGECRNNKECIIDKKNRTSCKACRLQKCLLVGMSKSGSRYGRRSNWFKQYFQENELRSKRTAMTAATTSSPTSRSISSEKCDRLSTSDEELEPELESQLSASPYSAFSTPLRYSSTAKDTIAAVTAAAAAAAASAFSDLPQTPVSSHLYLNCFPHLSLNQLVAYRHDSTKFLGPNAVPLAVLPNDHIHRYWDKLFEAQVHRPELAAECESEDPLDLSARKHKEDGSATDYGATKRLTPLDLSVK